MPEMVMAARFKPNTWVQDITQGLKTVVGGELNAYSDMMQDTRNLATKER